MSRMLLSITVFSMTVGLIIGWRLPHLLERQALNELKSQCGTVATTRGFVLEKSQASFFAEDCIDWSLKLVMADYLRRYRQSLRSLDLKQLSEVADIQKKYENCLRDMSLSLHHGEYRVAAGYANTALSLRALRVEPKSPWRINGQCQWDELYSLSSEEYFAENLCSLGMYAEAKSVILTLPEIPTTSKSLCSGPFVGYRRGVLAEAHLGLREYAEVTQELSKPIPDLIESNSTWAMIECLKGFAYLAKREGGSAKEAFSRWANNCPTPNAFESLLFRIPETGNEFTACRLSKEIIEFFERHQPDTTTPQNLDYCGAAMEAYGHTAAAELLFSKAREVRQQ